MIESEGGAEDRQSIDYIDSLPIFGRQNLIHLKLQALGSGLHTVQRGVSISERELGWSELARSAP